MAFPDNISASSILNLHEESMQAEEEATFCQIDLTAPFS